MTDFLQIIRNFIGLVRNIFIESWFSLNNFNKLLKLITSIYRLHFLVVNLKKQVH
jgi:hypothetical protein